MAEVLQFGATGQLGRALGAAAAAAAHRVTVLDRAAADFGDPAACAAIVRAARPDLVLIAAAETRVDAAEDAAEAAHRVNAETPGAIAAASAKIGAALVTVSTDYVFDGAAGAAPYAEDAAPRPVNVYGASKLAGERAVLQAHPGAAVLRASWVFDATGKNFFRTMLRLGAERDALTIVDDQISAPTFAGDLAAAVWALGAYRLDGGGESGVFHLQCAPYASWADFAEAIFARAAPRLGRRPEVTRIPTSAYPTRAPRPLDTRLDGARLTRALGAAPSDWRRGLDAAIAAWSVEESA